MDITGLKTAVGMVHDRDMPVPDAENAVQMPLLPLDNAETGTDVQGERIDAPRGRGRPVGARNKSTKDWQQYLLSRYQSPLVVLAETYSTPVDVLATRLGCKKYEAYQLQMAAAKEVAPYVHQKMPMAIDAGESGLISLTINTGDGSVNAGHNDAMPTITLTPIDVTENSGFEAVETQKSNAIESNETLEAQKNSHKTDCEHAD